jgi:hypothetical protein
MWYWYIEVSRIRRVRVFAFLALNPSMPYAKIKVYIYIKSYCRISLTLVSSDTYYILVP